MIRGGLSHLDCYQITRASNFSALWNLEVDQAVILSSSGLAMSLRVLTTLSGGNQQKVILAKWLATGPKILLLDEPTRGIDVGAKYEIYLLMNELVAAGKAIVMISSELPEVLGMADRILVMHEGRVTGEIADARRATQEQVMQLAVA